VRLLSPALLVAVLPLLGVMAMQHEQRTNEHRLGAIAGEIAGRSVGVHCPGLLQKLVDVSPNSGSVYFDAHDRPADYTDLNDQTCSALDRFAEGKTDGEDSVKVARALHVLAHESFHLAGVRNEADADCFGLQRVAFTATELGAGPDEAQRLAAIAKTDRALSAPPEYRSSDCFDGGRLDLDSASQVWPKPVSSSPPRREASRGS
jgi:hypothetical protein